VGPTLSDGRRDSVMRPRLHVVAARAQLAEQAIVERACAAAAIAVHHDDARSARRIAHRVFGPLAFEAAVAAPEHDALHAGVASHELELRADESNVVGFTCSVPKVDARDVAFAEADGAQAALATDREELAGDAARAQPGEHDVETDAVASDHDEV